MRTLIVIVSLLVLVLSTHSQTQNTVSTSNTTIKDSIKVQPLPAELLKDSNLRKQLLHNGRFNAAKAMLLMGK